MRSVHLQLSIFLVSPLKHTLLLYIRSAMVQYLKWQSMHAASCSWRGKKNNNHGNGSYLFNAIPDNNHLLQYSPT